MKEFYASSIFDQNLPIEKVSFVALDFETTGLNPLCDDIVSIGLVPFDLRRVYCNKGSHWLINPRQPLAERSILVHGITHSAISEAPDLHFVLDEVLAALSGKVIVVHYSRIERDFLDRALIERLNEGIRFPVIDTMAIEASLHRKRMKCIWKLLKGEKPASLRLASSRERYGLPTYHSHHALTDAIATAELFLAQVAHHYSGNTPLAELWM